MKSTLSFITLLFIIAFEGFSQQSYKPESFESALMKTKDGAMLVYTGSKHAFTLDINSKNIKPAEQPNVVFVDDMLLQAVVLGFSQKDDFDNLSVEKQKSYLMGYMKYEMDYFKKELKQKLENESVEWVEINGRTFLQWQYDMPKSNKQIGKQLYLTTICFDQILNLNSAVMRENSDINAHKIMLTKVAKTLKTQNSPINLDELYKELNK